MKTPEQRQREREERGRKFKDPPLFSTACPGGRCGGCNGASFRTPLADRRYLLPFAFFEARKLTECVTCGRRFTRG